MNSLSSEQINQFQADLRSALMAGVPLSLSSRGKPVDAPMLEQLGHQARRGALGGEVSAAALEQDERQLPVRYRAALWVWAHTGNMSLVLDALTSDRQVERTISRSLRATLVYLLLLLAVGYVGLVVFTSFTAPRIDELQHDLALTPEAAQRATTDLTPWLTTALGIVPVAALVIIGAIWWAGGMAVVAKGFGADRYRVSAASATAARVAKALMAEGVAAARATELACDLVAGGSQTRDKVARGLSVAGERPPTAAGLATMAEQFRLVASQRLAAIGLVAPIALVAVLGGVMALAFAAVVFWPVVDLYQDIASIGNFRGAAP